MIDFFKEIVIGNNLEAIIYSYLNNVPIIINGNFPPFGFETIEDDTQELFLVKTDSKAKLFFHLSFVLSMSGLILVPKYVENVQIDEQEKVCSVFYGERKHNFHYEKLTIFNIDYLNGISLTGGKKKNVMVVDWFNCTKNSRHSLDLIKRRENFVKRVIFYPSERICVNYSDARQSGIGGKDAVSISYLLEKQLNDIDYSEIYVRIIIERYMKEKGYSPRLEHDERELRRFLPSNLKDGHNISFNYSSISDLISSTKVDKIKDYYYYNMNKIIVLNM